jgi:hypothetical protein
LGKIFRWILVVSCLSWSILAAIFLIRSQDNDFNPKVLFSEQGEMVTVIHRPSECNLEELFPQISSGMHADISPILAFIEKKHARIYFSSFRDFCLIEGTSNWRKEDIRMFSKILGSTPIKQGTMEWKLNSSLHCEMHANMLLLYKNKPKRGELSTAITWDLIDKSASYTLVNPTNDKVENIYANRSERYLSQAKSSKSLRLVDDYELFAGNLPEDILKYEFVQTEALKFYLTAEELQKYGKLPENGIVVFNYKGKNCLLLDPALGYDPIQMYENEKIEDRDDFVKFTTEQFNLPSLSYVENESYALKTGGNLIICGDQETAKAIDIAYKLGKTFALKNCILKEGFFQLPKKVSYRSIANEAYETTSYLDGYMHTTKLRVITNEAFNETDLVEDKGEILATLGGEIKYVYYMNNPLGLPCLLIRTSNGSSQFVNTSVNKQSTGASLVQASVPSRVIIDREVYWNVHADLSFSLIDKNGLSRNGYPLNLPKIASSNVIILKEKGKNFYLFGTPNGSIEKYNSNWKLVKSTTIGNGAIKSIQYSESGNVLANVNNEAWFIGSLANLKMGKTTGTKIDAILESSDPLIVGKFYSNAQGVYFVSPNQAPTLLKKGSGYLMHQVIADGSQTKVIVSNGGYLSCLSDGGALSFSFGTELNTIESASMIIHKGKKYIAVLDGIQNNISLHHPNGSLFKERIWEGSKNVYLQNSQNQLSMLTFVGRYLIKYTLNPNL